MCLICKESVEKLLKVYLKLKNDYLNVKCDVYNEEYP